MKIRIYETNSFANYTDYLFLDYNQISNYRHNSSEGLGKQIFSSVEELDRAVSERNRVHLTKKTPFS